MSDYFVTPPNQGNPWQPPIFGAAQNLSVRALSWRTLLYDLLFSVYEIGTPKGWHLTPFRYQLFGYGSTGIVYDDELGWVYGFFGVERIGWQWDPILFHVTLPNGESKPIKGIRGVNGVVLHVHDDWTGYEIIIDQYAEMLAACDKCTSANLNKARIGKLIGVENKKDAEAIKAALGKTEDGDPVAYVSSKLFDDDGRIKTANVIDIASEFMADKVMMTRLMILKEFLTRVGVRTVGMEKREHLLDQEISENNDETGAEPYVVMSSLKDDLEMLNSMGCALSIKPRYDYSGAGIGSREGGNNGGEQNVN